MSQTAARMLGLLSLLMVPRTWSGGELADRLGVSPRTVRNDIGALREIGYAIEGTRGNEGGYRLAPYGSAVPPLLLDSDEAVAVAVGLHSGLSCIIGGMEETSARALAKLENILPAAVRARVHNLAHFTVPVAGNQPMPIVDPNLIVILIDHCHRRERLRFVYHSDGPVARAEERETHLEVEPYRVVNRQHRWYLLTFDPDAGDWRIFLAERISPKTPSGPRFEPRPLPAEDIGEYVERHISGRRWRHSATVIVDAPASEVTPRLASAEGTVEPLDGERSLVTIGGQNVLTMALSLARLDLDFTVVDSPELRECLQELSYSLGRAAQESGNSEHSVPSSHKSG
ncbi:helix-turn-helix transcriptional regulator [Brevibacterium renqingii]|uniref:helix-turn-helix transcriptional regulator n=1 Tax=Brevibacterium renqingii TaxID=2776916 RepID=UPI001ADFB4FF|nr:WYL domain-containing protein [Brevibacterium renqingii]